ncbi:MAG: carbohydrate kinase [Eubacteriales bacterium]|nr:carbohydrate kinase [Clostridiales bacterium]MDY5836958.1 carbohydrate kinase [Eubacteriales bacterium]
MDIYCIGEMVIDFIPGHEPMSYIYSAGGAPANVAIELSRNGYEAAMCCAVGEDTFGKFIHRTLKENRVQIIKPERISHATTTMAFVSLQDGERSFTFARKPGADRYIDEADVREADIAQSRIVHAGSCSLSVSPAAEATRKALRLGREHHLLTSFDVNYRDVMWDRPAACVSAVESLLSYVDMVKMSEEEVTMFVTEERDLPTWMKRQGIHLLVETLGAAGARAFWKDIIIEAPSHPAKPVDTTAAGDAFWGAFLSSLLDQGLGKAEDLSQEMIQQALAYGNASGWLCVQTKGAISALPDRSQIVASLENLNG